ncbi:metallopeptidase family protein [Specibacter sp. NPDC057265]|uniref:metallopeptidase family protein n=1 Tax=Specibacter sp. NPDC057265 TaxID=3346075 RepID=UPI0036435432
MEFKAGAGEQALSISLDPAADGTDGGTGSAAVPAKPFDRRRRDRHGRGLRGPLIPSPLPGHRTRGQIFDELVVESADRLRTLWPGTLDLVVYLVEEVPGELEALIAAGTPAPLGKFVPATGGDAAQITIYRHPVEALCDTPGQLRELVHEVLVEQVAGFLDMDPDAVDPSFRRYRGH